MSPRSEISLGRVALANTVNGLSSADAHAAKQVGKIKARSDVTHGMRSSLTIRRPREASAFSTSHLMNVQRKNIAAKPALNKLQIRREEFTAWLCRGFKGGYQAHCKRTMKLMTESRL